LKRDIDIGAIDDYLAYGYIPSPSTIYSSIKKLAPAQYLIWRDGKTIINSYWSVRFRNGPRKKESEYAEELLELIKDSIRLRLRSDVPIGAFLSGGIDSNGIVALASLELEKPLKTFSVGFEFSDMSELSLARLTTKRYGTDHHEIIVTDRDIISFDDLVEHYDEPFGDPSMLPTFLIAKEANKYVKVCLSGDAGDEVFGGYNHYIQALQYQKADFIPAIIRRFLFGNLASILPDYAVGKGFLRRLEVSSASRYQRMIGIFDSKERLALYQQDISQQFCKEAGLFEDYFPKWEGDLLSLCQYVDQKTYLPEDINVKVDRASMKNSLEVRIPFLDHRLVDYVNSLPPDLKIAGKVQKYLLRSVFSKFVPQEILSGPKRGFAIPIKYWFRNELKSFARDLLLSNDSRIQKFIRKNAIEKLLLNHERGRRDLSERIWSLLVLEQWCRKAGL